MPKIDWINDGPSPLSFLIKRDKIIKEMDGIWYKIEHTDCDHYDEMMVKYEELRKELYELNRWNEF